MSESNISEKIERGIGQRGTDREPREFNPKSLLNLKQFQKPVSSIDSCVNSGVNTDVNWSKIGKIATVVIVISALIWKLYQKRKKSDFS